MNPYSTEKQRKEEESTNNFIRLIAYQMNKVSGSGVHTPLLFRER